jgi:hypothetical protein
MVENNTLIPNHQFGFRQRHSTIEQAHQIVQRINEALENKQCCSAAFLDISQAFNNVWHTGLLYKLRRSIPLNYFHIIKSYLHSRHFLVKVETEYTELSSVNADVTQGSVLGCYYTCYTLQTCQPNQNLPQQTLLMILQDSDPATASQKLQTDLLEIQNWFKKLENESQRIQVYPRNIHYTKRKVPLGPYKQCATPPRRRYHVSWATP